LGIFNGFSIGIFIVCLDVLLFKGFLGENDGFCLHFVVVLIVIENIKTFIFLSTLTLTIHLSYFLKDSMASLFFFLLIQGSIINYLNMAFEV